MLLYHFLLVDQKSFFHRSLHCNLLFLHLEYIIFYCLFFDHHFQTLKQKVYLLLESLAQLNDLSFDFFVNNAGVDMYLFQLIVLLKSDFNCGNNFALT